MSSLNFQRLIDISQPVAESTACFPGDTPFSRKITASYAESGIINLTALTMSPHVGTHADAPVHIKGSLDATSSDTTAGELPLEPFIGRALVLDFAPTTAGINAAMLQEKLASSSQPCRRILLKTQAVCRHQVFQEDYSYITEDAAAYLSSQGFVLVGIDTPSVDHIRSKDLPTHAVLDKGNLVWLENLDLSQVEAGEYLLIALPLKFMELEASPVRAILLA